MYDIYIYIKYAIDFLCTRSLKTSTPKGASNGRRRSFELTLVDSDGEYDDDELLRSRVGLKLGNFFTHFS